MDVNQPAWRDVAAARPDESDAIFAFLDCWRTSPIDALRRFVGETVVFRHWRWRDETLRGRDEVLERYIEPLATAYGTWSFTIEDAIVARDRLVIRGRFRALFEESFHGVEATGRPVSWCAHDIYRFENGTIAEAWYANDTYVVAREMGVVDGSAPWPWTLPEPPPT